MSNLLPCPKCGCPDEVTLDSNADAEASWIECGWCEHRMQRRCDEETLAEKWNALSRKKMPEFNLDAELAKLDKPQSQHRCEQCARQREIRWFWYWEAKKAQRALAQQHTPSALVGVEGIDASDNADYIEHCADVLREHGYRVTASALAYIATEHRALAQKPAAVDGPYRLVDDVVTVNGMALDEVVRLGDRYAATIEKRGMPRAAQVFEALVLIGKHALAAQQGGSDNDR